MQLDAGEEFACAVDDAGGVDCWGDNGGVSRTTPAAGLYTQVTTGHLHACGPWVR